MASEREASGAAVSEVEHNWFNVTTWADRDWKASQVECLRRMSEAKHDPAKIEFAKRCLIAHREDYRRRVLSWYRKLCLPMQIGDAVPNRVAELLAEAWDLGELRQP
jgi:hypothetical protein